MIWCSAKVYYLNLRKLINYSQAFMQISNFLLRKITARERHWFCASIIIFESTVWKPFLLFSSRKKNAAPGKRFEYLCVRAWRTLWSLISRDKFIIFTINDAGIHHVTLIKQVASVERKILDVTQTNGAMVDRSNKILFALWFLYGRHEQK